MIKSASIDDIREGKFIFHWNDEVVTLKEVINELSLQYADVMWNNLGVGELQSGRAKYNLELLTLVIEELR